MAHKKIKNILLSFTAASLLSCNQQQNTTDHPHEPEPFHLGDSTLFVPADSVMDPYPQAVRPARETMIIRVNDTPQDKTSHGSVPVTDVTVSIDNNPKMQGKPLPETAFMPYYFAVDQTPKDHIRLYEEMSYECLVPVNRFITTAREALRDSGQTTPITDITKRLNRTENVGGADVVLENGKLSWNLLNSYTVDQQALNKQTVLAMASDVTQKTQGSFDYKTAEDRYIESINGKGPKNTSHHKIPEGITLKAKGKQFTTAQEFLKRNGVTIKNTKNSKPAFQ